MDMNIDARRLDLDLPLPSHERQGDAGIDLRVREGVRLEPGERRVVGSGIALAIPSGYVGLVAPRSGLASRVGLSIANPPGVVDSGYRGEIKLALVNIDRSEPITIERGERVAQLLVVPVATVTCVEVSELPASERGDRGHGSTGT